VGVGYVQRPPIPQPPPLCLEHFKSNFNVQDACIFLVFLDIFWSVFANRKGFKHNIQVAFMPTSFDSCIGLFTTLSVYLEQPYTNRVKQPSKCFVPLIFYDRGMSSIDFLHCVASLVVVELLSATDDGLLGVEYIPHHLLKSHR